jgi:hypothetical protein
MDLSRLAEAQMRVRHQHKDGAWAEMGREESHHGPADHDAERDWNRGFVYRCHTCPETVIVDLPDEVRHGQ